MIDHVNNLKLQYLVELSKLGDECVQVQDDIESWLRDHDVVFDGATIPFVLMPHFISPGQAKRVRTAVTALSRVLDRFCDAYPENARLRDELKITGVEDELIRLDPGYNRPMRICRLDAFLLGYDVRFLEFNSDSPAGIGYTDILYEGLTDIIDLPRVRAEFETSYTPMLPQLFVALRDAYSQFRTNKPEFPEAPRIALIDSDDSPSVPEFRIFCKAAALAGLDAVYSGLSDVEYDGSRVLVEGEPCDLIYRRALYEEATDSPISQAARDGRACIVNPFRARVANNKKIFALLQDPRFAHLIEGSEADVIQQTIPWTRILRSGRVTYGTWTVDLIPFTIDNRERLVLKPASDYGGHGVALGMETDENVWEQIINENIDSENYIVQEYVPVPEEMFPTVIDGHVNMKLKRYNINPFGIGGRYAGSITRISDQAVINVSAGGGLLPSVVGRHKRKLLVEDDEEQEIVHGSQT